MTSFAKKKENEDKGSRFNLNRRGVMLALSSPSGAGKTTISRRLLDVDDKIRMSVSATTRIMRPGEEEGKHYFFMAPERFQLMVDNDEFLESAQVYGRMYGTPRQPVEEALSNGQDVMFDIDWQGTRRLSQQAPEDLVSIFILPPTWEELKNRLVKRGQDSAEEIASRMDKAQDEISHYDEYHYVIVNYDVDESIKHVRAILDAERLKRRRMAAMDAFVKTLAPPTL